ncbi:hypothetical protein [Melittangium boletus]|uniref:Lipoprotein n=1 Tax=Melittangium boletus DSM 14713 TaxID=1294270 RepID=A0A250IP21_9BACT|nr:hypothetical protein [Melittangium boletus]ATB32931.1 hypothetical protein MEBOL_006420 [Melittangium boletus DSM 14713]
MKNALPLLAALCLATGCHKNTADAPPPPPTAPVETPSYRDAGQPSAPPSDSGTGAQGAEPPAAREACVDQWLKAHQLDRYGHPEGTMYAGGSPLFNEATGETQDRLEHVFARQPEAKKACPGTDAR